MKCLIAGGSGFIGSALIEFWLSQQHEISVLGRDKQKIVTQFSDRVRAISWDEFEKNSHALLQGFDCVVNLCGANIGEKRWSAQRRAEILQSRIEPTQKIAAALAAMQHPPRLLNASAIGSYGLQNTQTHNLPPAFDEQSALPSPAPDFLSEVAQAWERATQTASHAGVSVVNLRFGVVLAAHNGALAQLAKPFRFGLGAVIGSGAQPFSWIALDDAIRAIDFLAKQPAIVGPVNLVSVQAVSQREFAHTLARVLHRPCLLTIPGWVLKIALGKMADELVLSGQHVVPTRLRELNFRFDYPTLDLALTKIFHA